MSAPSVRPATPSDLDVLVAFNLAMACETEDHALDPSRLRAGVLGVLRDPSRGRYSVAEIDGKVVGSLLVTREWSDWRDAWFWWIQSVYVAPASRRRGVYSALHGAVIESAHRAGDVYGVRLYVESANGSAQATYERLGMRRARYQMYEVEIEPGTPGG